MAYPETHHQAGYYRGEPVPAHFAEVQKLGQEDRLDEAIASLLALIDATEEDDLFTGSGVESAYYEELAKIYRKKKEYLKEIKTLARYSRHRHAYGDPRQQILKERLEEAKNLLHKDQSTS